MYNVLDHCSLITWPIFAAAVVMRILDVFN